MSKREEKLDAVRDLEILDVIFQYPKYLILGFDNRGAFTIQTILKVLVNYRPKRTTKCKESLKHEFFEFDFINNTKEKHK